MPQSLDFGDKFVLICEEAEICKRLSSNDIKVRRKGVAALKHLLKNIDNRKGEYLIEFPQIMCRLFLFFTFYELIYKFCFYIEFLVVDSTDFSRLWNGIFNFIWMSDKLLVQVSCFGAAYYFQI